MLENVSERLTKVMKYLKGEATITENNMKTALREIKLSLLEADVNFKVVKKFIANIKEKSMGVEVRQSLSPYQHIIKIVKDELITILGNENVQLTKAGKPTIIMVAGLQGAGKTTSCGKLALHLKEQGLSPLLCSLDLKRMAAVEQLEIISKEINVNFFKHKSNKLKAIVKDLTKHAKEYGHDYIIVDSAGRLHIDKELMKELKEVKEFLKPHETIFVADALTGQDAVNSAQSFDKEINIDSVILTKMDADSRGGAALSISSITEKPIKFIGVGEKYKDLEKFHPDRLASKILGMGDVLSLIEKAEKEFDEKEAEKVAKKMLKNQFTLQDFLDQLKQMEKLGSIKDIMGLMPRGQANLDLSKANIDEKKIAHMIAIINSMTPKEREKPAIINGQRRLRISKGSGRKVQEINQLLKSFKEMQKMMKKPFFKKMLKKVDFFKKMG